MSVMILIMVNKALLIVFGVFESCNNQMVVLTGLNALNLNILPFL